MASSTTLSYAIIGYQRCSKRTFAVALRTPLSLFLAQYSYSLTHSHYKSRSSDIRDQIRQTLSTSVCLFVAPWDTSLWSRRSSQLNRSFTRLWSAVPETWRCQAMDQPQSDDLSTRIRDEAALKWDETLSNRVFSMTKPAAAMVVKKDVDLGLLQESLDLRGENQRRSDRNHQKQR